MRRVFFSINSIFSGLLMIFSVSAPVAFLSACNYTGTTIGLNYLPGVQISYTKSTVTTSASTVRVGNSVGVTLYLRDQNSAAYLSTLPTVTFQASGGTSAGTLGAVTNNGDGSYSTTFSGVTVGSATAIYGVVNGSPLQSSRPTIQVTSSSPNITATAGNNQSAERGTQLSTAFTATAIDANGNALQGAIINWAVTAGAGTLSAETTTTSSNGTVVATLTLGTTPGTNIVTATINGTSIFATFIATGTTSPLIDNIWNLISANSSTFTYGATIDFAAPGGVCELEPAAQIDNEATSLSVSTGFTGGNFTGAAWDSGNNEVRLAQTGTPTNNSELDSSWAPAWSNIVGYWKLDDAAGSTSVVDSSPVGTNSLTVNGGVTLGTTGKLSTAASFNGSTGYLSNASPSQLSFEYTHPFTLSSWINTSNASQNNFILAKQENSGNFNGYYDFLTPSGNLQCLIQSSQLNYAYIESSVIFNDGQWHQAVCMSNGNGLASGLSIYKDGVLDTEASVVGDDLDSESILSSAAFTIGSRDSGGQPFSGVIDEAAVWNINLTPTQVQTVYSRQSAKYAGTLTSRVMDGLASGANWTTLGWTSTLPFYKELPDYSGGAVQNETSTNYSALEGDTPALGDNNLMTGIEGLWHLDETAGAMTVTDNSGQGNTGTVESGTTLGVSGKLGAAANFNGSTGYIDTGAGLGTNFTTGNFSLSAWVQLPSGVNQGAYILARRLNSTPFTQYGVLAGYVNSSGSFVSAQNIGFFLDGQSGTLDNTNTGSYYTANAFGDGKWHHVVCVRNGSSGAQIWVDGVDQTLTTVFSGYAMNLNSTSSHFTIGSGGSTNYFNGGIDEVAVWDKALNSTEIIQLYRRGINRTKYQIQTCATASACASSPNWQGPDGTNQTYFSELNNNKLPADGGDLSSSDSVNATSPTMTFSSFPGPMPSATRYFQYRAILESDDTSTNCNYGSGATWCSPELQSVTVGPNHYDSSSPTVVSQSGINFYSLSGAIETLGGGGCGSGVVYNLGIGASSSSATWYYWSGSAWVSAGGTTATANSAAGLTNAVLSTFGSSVGNGTVYLKAFLQSSGTSACQFSSFQLNGLN
jgi:hypothetical protein